MRHLLKPETFLALLCILMTGLAVSLIATIVWMFTRAA